MSEWSQASVHFRPVQKYWGTLWIKVIEKTTEGEKDKNGQRSKVWKGEKWSRWKR